MCSPDTCWKEIPFHRDPTSEGTINTSLSFSPRIFKIPENYQIGINTIIRYRETSGNIINALIIE